MKFQTRTVQSQSYTNMKEQPLFTMDEVKDEMSFALFGRSRQVALAGGQCVKCGQHNLEFRDELSRKEYGISALCQTCQDSIFNTEEE